MNNEKQIEKIYEPIARTDDEMRKLADEMSKAISTEYEKRVLADERKLEAVLKENGWRKASEVARNIFGNLRILAHIDFDGNICIRKDSFDELEKNYTEATEGEE